MSRNNQPEPRLIALPDLQVGDLIYSKHRRKYQTILMITDIVIFDESRRAPFTVGKGTRSERNMTVRDLGGNYHLVHIKGLSPRERCQPYDRDWDKNRTFYVTSVDGKFETNGEKWTNVTIGAYLNASKAKVCYFHVLREDLQKSFDF